MQWFCSLLCVAVLTTSIAPSNADGRSVAANHEVVWTSLGTNENDSMPIGNGALAVLQMVQALYRSGEKSVGAIRSDCTPSFTVREPFRSDSAFTWIHCGSARKALNDASPPSRLLWARI